MSDLAVGPPAQADDGEWVKEIGAPPHGEWLIAEELIEKEIGHVDPYELELLVDAATALYRYTVVYLRSARKWQADAVAQVSLLHDKTSAHVALSAIEEADAHWVVVFFFFFFFFF